MVKLYGDKFGKGDMYELYPRGAEIDMRDEFMRTLLGDDWEKGKRQLFIYRRMRRDALEQLVPCVCLSDVTNEGDRDRFCPYCFGEGFLWDEEWVSGLHVLARRGGRRSVQKTIFEQWGMIDPSFSFMYLPYKVCPSQQDKIISPQITPEGEIIWPIEIMHYFRIDSADPVRNEHGRVELWSVTVRENLPGKND